MLRTGSACALGAAILALGLAGCSGGSGAGVASRSAAKASCPAPYDVLNAAVHYTPRQTRQALQRHRFHVHITNRRLEPPVNWLQDPYNSQAFRSNLANLQWTGVLFDAYRNRGDVGALRQARNLILDWVRHQPYGGQATSDRAWEAKVIADRVPTLAYMLRAGTCAHILSQRQRQLLLDSAVRQGELLTQPSFHPPSNHGLFVDAGLLLLSHELSFLPQAQGWEALAKQRFRQTFFGRMIASEGMWLEPSAGYQLLAVGLLEKYLALPGVKSQRLHSTLHRMKQVAGWLVEPDRQIVQIGDTDIDRATRDAIVQGEHDRGMLWLARSGLAVVKVPRRSYLSVISSFHTEDHKHADDLSFDLFDRGHRIVSDTGLYDKDPGRYYQYEHSARAHSTLTVDGKDFPLTSQFAYGSGLLARGQGDGWYAIEGTNPIIRKAQGVTQDRLFLYKPGQALIVVDRVRSRQRHTYQRYFQLGPDIQASPRGPELRLRASGLNGALYSESSQGPEHRSEVKGRNRPLAGYTFPLFRKRVPRWTVKYTSAGRNIDYVTTFSLAGPGIRAHLTKASPLEALRLTDGSGPARTLSIRRHGARLRVRELPAGGR